MEVTKLSVCVVRSFYRLDSLSSFGLITLISNLMFIVCWNIVLVL
jgi:hypothetical protein